MFGIVYFIMVFLCMVFFVFFGYKGIVNIKLKFYVSLELYG